jgi:hypothetical protein
MELIKENSFAKAEYNAENNIIYSKYGGKVDSKKALEVLEAQLKFSESNKVKAIHADLSDLSGTFTMINEWLEKNFFPVLIERGMVCHAFVVSPDIFSGFALDNLIKRIGSFEMQTFKNSEKSEEWMLAKLKE